jgi:hypothetical protein
MSLAKRPKTAVHDMGCPVTGDVIEVIFSGDFHRSEGHYHL